MAGDVNSNIFINIDTTQAMAQLRALEKELTALNRALVVGTKTASQAQSKYAQSLLHNVNATGQWTASVGRMRTASEQFASSLDKSKLSLKEYFRYGMASTKTFGRLFGNEFDTVGKLVEKRVKVLQQQYVQLGRDAQGAMNALKFTPKALNYKDVTTQLMMAVQRQQIFNKLLDDGATKLLNFGKNTQWAGRQLMVGFTIPLMLFGAQAVKTFKEIETQVIRFKKVYGDIFTDQGATDQALKNIRALADEYTKYGLKVADTIGMAAEAAAAGFSGKGLENLVEQTNKLAVLGGVAQEKALETTIALRNAFQIDESKLSGTIDFLNAVENQTVVALEDLTEAIPRVAPVVQQLGGDVKDLAFFMAAMQEGGISAAQGANALKSGLASLINPSKKASASAAELGINLKGIVEENAGNLRNIIMAFAKSLQPLTDLQKSRIIEQIFGKYQFARISALLNNVTKEGSQAARVLQLANASVEELAILTERELKVQADSPMNKLAGAVERLKKAIAPIGQLFAEVLTPVIEYIGKIAEKFSKLPDGVKKAIAVIVGIIGGLGPIFLMTFGLIANAFANGLKGVNLLRKGYQQLAYGSSDAALKTQYLTNEELENISVTNSLYSKHEQLSAAYRLEQQALASLIATYNQANVAMGGFASKNPGLFMPGRGVPPKRFATGTTSVPGPRGAGDIVPSMLSPGEAVIPAKQSEKYSGFISQIIQDKVPGFAGGLFPAFGAASTVGKGVPLSAGPAAFREAQQARYAARDAARKGLSINAKPLIPQIPGLVFEESSNGLIKVMAGDAFFYIKKDGLPKLQGAMKEHQEFMVSSGEGSKTLSEIIKQIKRPGGGKNPRAPHQGRTITPSEFYKTLPKWGQARNRTQGIDVANKRYDLLLKSKNPHLLKLKNYLETEEKEYLRRVLSPEVFSTLNFEAKRLAPSHIREVGTERAGSWTPDKIARDWDWFNKALIGTKMGNVSGAHPLNAVQAQEIINSLLLKRQNKKSLGQDLSARQQGLLAALQYRINRKPSFYDDFVIVDNAMMKRMPKTMNLANGIISVPGPKGAGDIQPAMLSPGEAVIPARQSEKYMPLIRSIVADQVPGFEESNLDKLKNKARQIGSRATGSETKNLADAVAKSAARTVPMPVFSDLKDSVEKNTAAVQGDTDATKSSTQTAKQTAQEERRLARTRGIPGLMLGYGKVPDTDPESGRKLSYAEKRNYRQNVRMQRTNALMMPSMAASMAGSMAMMYGMAKPESFAGQNMNLIMALTVFAGLLPMINSPLKMMIASVIGITALFKLQSAQIKKSIIDGQKQAKSMMMTTDNLEALGKITGTVSIAQEEEAKRRSRTTEIVPVSMDFGKNIISNSDYGKQLKAAFDQTVATLGVDAGARSLVGQLATGVSQGVLTAIQAESIAIAITRDLKDARLELDVRSRLTELIGPNGQNILEKPLQVQLDIIASNKELQRGAFANLQNVIGQQRSGIVGIGGAEGRQLALGAIPAAGAAAYGVGAMNVAMAGDAAGKVGALGKIATGARAMNIASKASATVPIAGWASAILGTIIFGGIELGIRKFQQGKEKQAIGKAAGLFQGIASENMKASQQALDALNVEIGIAIKNLEAKKKAAKTAKERADIESRILDLEAQRASGGKDIRKAQGDILRDVGTQFEQIDKRTFWETFIPGGTERGALREKFMESFDIGLKEKFKGNAAATADLTTLTSLLEGKFGRGEGDAITLKIQTLIDSDVLTPREAAMVVQNLSSDTKKAEKQLTALIDVQGTEGLQRLSTIMTFIPNEKNRKQLFLDIQRKDKEEADATLAGIEELIKIPKYIGIILDMETNPEDYKDMLKLGKEIGLLKKLIPDGQISLDVLTKVKEDLTKSGQAVPTTLQNAIDQWDVISKLPKELRFQAVFTLTTLKTSDSFESVVSRELEAAYQKATSDKSIIPQYAERYSRWLQTNAKEGSAIRKNAEAKALTEIFGYDPTDTSKVPGAVPAESKEGGSKGSWLQDIGQRLKLLKESSFDALSPLKELRKFYGEKTSDTVNPVLQYQKGALDAIRKSAKDTGIVLSEEFMGIIEGFSADEFKNFAKDFLILGKGGNVKGINNDFRIINAGLRSLAAAELIKKIDEENAGIKRQVDAYKILVKQGYNRMEIERILQDETMVAMIADQGFLSLSIDERTKLNEKIKETIALKKDEALTSLDNQIDSLENQAKAYDILKNKQIDEQTILEILKNQAYVMAVVTGQGIDEIIAKTEKYLGLLKKQAEQQKTMQEKAREAITFNKEVLDLQAAQAQNKFDTDTFDIRLKIKVAQKDIDDINKKIQEEQDKIDAINLKVKYEFDIPMADLQEEINDMQRTIEEVYDRPLSALSGRSTILSNDLELMDRAADKINEKYDAQAKALEQVSQINQDIINQQKGQLDLASALSQGDIASAAKAAQEMRSQAASAAAQQSGNLINAARQQELGSLVSASGMTRKQIEEEQFQISQKSFNLEQAKKKNQEEIVKLEDSLYLKQEARESLIFAIRGHEKAIDDYRTKDLANAQNRLDDLQAQVDKHQAILDAKIDAIDKERLSWEATGLALDAYELALKEINMGELATMKSIVDGIVAAFNSIKGKIKSNIVIGGNTEIDDNGDLVVDGNDASVIAAAEADAAAALDALIESAELLDAALLSAENAANAFDDAANSGQWWKFDELLRKKAEADAALAEANELYAKNANIGNLPVTVGGSGGAGGGRFDTQMMSSGGMVKPKYFAVGGKARGTDIIPAMLTPGEFVVNKVATSKYLPELEAMNNMRMPAFSKSLSAPTYGGTGNVISMPVRAATGDNTNNTNNVYNYSVGINVGGTNASPDNIARAVMNEIKYIDSQRIRGQR
jgi:TP901 family phage tail tape measure protein